MTLPGSPRSLKVPVHDWLMTAASSQYRVDVDPEAAAEREGEAAEPVRLEVTIPAQYPDEVPEFVVQYSHILPKQAAELTAYLKAEAEDLKGTVRLFTPGPDGVSDA